MSEETKTDAVVSQADAQPPGSSHAAQAAAKKPATQGTPPPTAKKKGGAVKYAADKVHVWPHLTRLEMLAALGATILLTLWSILVDAPLEEPANAARTPNPSKAPWYFLGLQEMLVYFDPWFAGVVAPTLIIVGLMVIPYVDSNPKGNGYYTFRERPFAVTTFLFGFLFLWIVMIMIGTFLRGPGWNMFMPWEYWDPHRVVSMTNQDLNEILARIPTWFGGAPWHWLLDNANPVVAAIGLSFVGLFFVVAIGGFGQMAAFQIRFFQKGKSPEERMTAAKFRDQLGLPRYYTVAVLYSFMLLIVLKMVLRLAFSLKYLVQLPWFNANI